MVQALELSAAGRAILPWPGASVSCDLANVDSKVPFMKFLTKGGLEKAEEGPAVFKNHRPK